MNIIKELGQHVTYADPAAGTAERRSVLCVLRPETPQIASRDPRLQALMYPELRALFAEAVKDYPDLDENHVHVMGHSIRFVPPGSVLPSYNRLQPTYGSRAP